MVKASKSLNIIKKGKNAPNKLINYILLVSLIALLLYSIFYVFRVTKSSKEEFKSLEVDFNKRPCKYTIVYIYSNSCSFCTSFTPTFDKFASLVGNYSSYCDITILKKEVSDLDSKEKNKYNITAFPTIVIMDSDGKIINTIIGKRDLESLKNEVMGSLKLNNSVVAEH